MTTNWKLYTLLGETTIFGKFSDWLTHVELKQLLQDVYNYVIRHSHPFCENCHGRTNVRKQCYHLFTVLNAKMVLIRMFKEHIKDQCPMNFKYPNIRYFIPAEYTKQLTTLDDDENQ